MSKKQSLDEVDFESFRAGARPMAARARNVTLKKMKPSAPAVSGEGMPPSLVLDGTWELAEGGTEETRLAGAWDDILPIAVPGSVHTALEAAGRIPDQTVGRNQEIACKESFKTWWCRTGFSRPQGEAPFRLIFGGVAVHCAVWLNGKKLGEHEGMFGGPEFDITEILEDENDLVVRIDPAPYKEGPDPLNPFFTGMNVGWTDTVVFNNVYGWHYSNCPALGIWRSVRVESAAAVSLGDPFVAAADTEGTVSVVLDLEGSKKWRGKLTGIIEPDNFKGDRLCFEENIASTKGNKRRVHLRFRIPDPRLWWPVDKGDPNLYRMQLTFSPGEGVPDRRTVTFGLRTIEMAPLPDGPKPDWYNWTFVVNGRPMFVKGTGWCTMDPLMDFSRERYDRFLSLARDEHCQMVRAWGAGMPETDDFYDLCDRYGIMVMQEWPTAWNSHNTQPYDALEETVRLNTLRIRNHPSLVMWGGGNESSAPFGKAIDMMGRHSIEMDGTRPFHRGEPWGGSHHAYPTYWGRQHPDRHVKDETAFWGEFGIASLPVLESARRYLPEDNRDPWAAADDSAFAYHMPVFNLMEGLDRMRQSASFFVKPDAGLGRFIEGTQLTQCICLRHTLERARIRWPKCSGALLYKLNDNFPAASWATTDWYGAPKIAHYAVQDAFAPLHAAVLFDSVRLAGAQHSLPVYLLDDSGELAEDTNWMVRIRAFDGELKEIAKQDYTGKGPIEGPTEVGKFSLNWRQAEASPLLVVAEVRKGRKTAGRTFYTTNYEQRKGCLFELPKTTLSIEASRGRARVTNTGKLPAVGVDIARPGHLDTFSVSDNYFWLDPGETVSLKVNSTQGLRAGAWNAKNIKESK